VPEVVENGASGWLAPFREVEQLTQCIEKAIRDPDMTYQAGLAGRERVKKLFKWEKTAATILQGARNLGVPMPAKETTETSSFVA